MLAYWGEVKSLASTFPLLASSSSLNLACLLYSASDNSCVQPLQPPVQVHVKVSFPLAVFPFIVLPSTFLALPVAFGMVEDNQIIILRFYIMQGSGVYKQCQLEPTTSKYLKWFKFNRSISPQCVKQYVQQRSASSCTIHFRKTHGAKH